MPQFFLYFMEHPIALYLVIGILSLCIGSFLNVVIYRLPQMLEQTWQQECQMLLHPEHALIDEAKLSLSFPASHCPHCQTPIRWYHNIPILSWLMLGGQCVACHQAIRFRYPLVELLTTVTSLIVVAVFGASLQMLFALVLTWVLIALTFIDLDTLLLPDRLTLPLAALGLMVNSFSIYTSASAAIWGYIIGFLCLWVVYYLFKLITGKEGMGYGDFKLLAALGAWMGPLMLPLIILLSSVLGVIAGIFLIKKHGRNQPFAFGPYIAIAGWIAFLWGDRIMYIYLGSSL